MVEWGGKLYEGTWRDGTYHVDVGEELEPSVIRFSGSVIHAINRLV